MKKMPDVMEAIFDACYLIFDLIAGILFFVYSKGNPLFVLYGVLTLTLCGGDAFHLVPRIKRAIYRKNDKIKRQLGIGLQVSSITMTVFYIILLFIWKLTFPTLTAPVWELKCSQFPSCVDFTGFNGIQNCVYCYYLSFFSKIALKHRPHYFHI